LFAIHSFLSILLISYERKGKDYSRYGQTFRLLLVFVSLILCNFGILCRERNVVLHRKSANVQDVKEMYVYFQDRSAIL